MAKAGRLEIDVVAQSTQFVREMRRVNDSVTSTARAVDRANRTIETGFAAAGKAVAAFGVGLATAIGVNSLSSLARLGKQALDSAGNLGELATQAGVTTTQLQQLQVAGLQVGISQEQLVNSLAQFGRRVGEAAQGTGELADTMARYGISATDSSGRVRASVDVLEDFADVVARAGSSQERLALVSDAFGSRIGARLLPLLSAGAGGFREWMETAEAAGLVLDEAFIQRADQASDSMATLQFAVAKGFEIGVVEAFNAEIGATVDNLTTAREAGEFFGRVVGNAMDAAVASLRSLQPFFETTRREFNALADLLRRFFEFTGIPFAFAESVESLVVEIHGGMPLVKGWNEELAEWSKKGKSAAGATEELTGELKRLADAGKILTQTSAQEERFLRSQEEINSKLEERIELFREMNREELGRRVGQREAGGLSAPGLPEDFERQLSDPFKNALEDIQREFTDVFDEISQGTIRSFEEMANSINGIFTRLSANIATLSLSPRPEDQQAFAAMAQQAGMRPGQLQALALAPSAIGLGVGLFGNQQQQQGMNIGGGVGGLVGTGAGFAIGGPAGGLIGGMIGQAAGQGLGALFGGIFGGGGSRGRDTSGGSGILGAAGISGTGQAAQFVRTLDRQLIGLMTARQEQIANTALQFAPAVQVKFQEQPSAGDLARLAAGRIGPTAAALGFNAAAVAAPGLSPDEQFANLQTAVALMRQIEGFRIGSIATQFRDLNDQFVALADEANRLGVSTDGLADAHRRAAQELQRQLQQEQFSLAGAVGAMSDLQVQLHLLNLEMQRAGARAQEMGVSIAGISREHIRLAEALVRQNRAQEIAVEAQVGNIGPLQSALLQLNLQMQEAYAAATRLGVGTANIAQEHRRLADALIRENQAVQDQLALSITSPFEQLMDPLKEFFGELTVGNLNPAGQMRAAADEFHRIAALATAGSTTAIQQLQGAGEAFIAQAERFGASPAGVAARTEVASVIEQVMGSIEQAQRQASAGVEDAVRTAQNRIVDTLRELITEGALTREEIKRLRR